jgi:hypothetical protein
VPDSDAVIPVTVVLATRQQLHREIARWLHELGVSGGEDLGVKTSDRVVDILERRSGLFSLAASQLRLAVRRPEPAPPQLGGWSSWSGS